MKRLFAFLCALALLLSLSACTAASPDRPGETVPTGPLFPPQTEPVRRITCLDLPEGMQINHAVALGDGLLAVKCCRWDGEGETALPLDERTYLVDAFEDRTPGYTEGMQTVIGRRPNGEILVLDSREEELRFYDGAFTLLRTLPLPPETFAAAYDRYRDRLYWTEKNTLILLSPETGERQTVALDRDAAAELYDPRSGSVLFTLPSANDRWETDWGLYDLKTETVLTYGSCDAAFSFQFTGDRFFYVEYVAAEEETGEYESVSTFLTLYDPAGDRALRRWKAPEEPYWEGEYGLPFLIGAAGLYDGETETETGIFAVADPEEGRIAHPVDMTGLTRPGVCRDPDTGRIFLYAQENGRGSLRVIEPALISFDGRMEPAPLPDPPEPAAPEEDYGELSAMARSIEQDFPVSVLLGDGIFRAAGPGDYYFRSFIQEDLPRDQALEEAADSLRVLRTALQIYPEGFLARFRQSRGAGGLRILLVGEILNDQYGSFDAAGLSYGHGAWYNLALEIGEVNDPRNVRMIHHELWHATERRICDLEPSAFDLPEWAELNPPGFEYDADFDHYWRSEDLDRYIMGNGADRDTACFISSYSTVTAMEDRATIIETLFTDGDVKDFYPDCDSYYEAVCRCPRLKAKLDYMEKWTRAVFGCVYWRKDPLI